jgi:hypothetical protein
MVVKPIEFRNEVYIQRKKHDLSNAISLEENTGPINTFLK